MRRRKQPVIYGGKLADQRKYVGFALLALTLGGGYYSLFSGGLPILWGPTASAAEVAAGRDLFEHEWQPNDPLAHGDGLGPVFNAKSCVACHFQGGAGGGGEVAHNAVNYEVLPRPLDPDLHVGTVHNFSVDKTQKETFASLRKVYPVIKGEQPPPPPPSPDPHCGYVEPSRRTPDFDPVRLDSVNTTALFGAGWIDLISDKAILLNARTRAVRNVVNEIAADFSDIPVGKARLLPDGRIGKFGWRGQFATLEEFVAAACANEIGLGTPMTKQPKPLMLPTAADVTPDLDRKQFRSLVAFVKTLPKPVEVESADADHGKAVFASVGCAACHVPDMGGVRGVYSDFLLYTLDDPTRPGSPDPYGPTLPDRPRPDDLPRPEEWKTPPLWGVADSAPYMHDGGAPTLDAAIRRHRGEGKGVSEAFFKLPAADQAAVIGFLKSLKAPADAPVVRNPATKLIARR